MEHLRLIRDVAQAWSVVYSNLADAGEAHDEEGNMFRDIAEMDRAVDELAKAIGYELHT